MQSISSHLYHHDGWLHRRRGVMMTELIVSAVLLGAAVGIVVPMLQALHRSSRMNEQQAVAARELSALMERLAVLKPEQVTPQAIAAMPVSAIAAETLLEHKLDAEVAEVEGLKRVTLVMNWVTDTGTELPPIRLTAWLNQ